MANKPLQSIKFPGLSDTYTTPQVDATLTTTGAAADAKKVGDEITSVKQDLSDMNTATSGDVGKALKVKTVSNGKVTEWEFGETAVIDKTLTQSDQAADAKIVGDSMRKIGNIVNEENITSQLAFGNYRIIQADDADSPTGHRISLVTSYPSSNQFLSFQYALDGLHVKNGDKIEISIESAYDLRLFEVSKVPYDEHGLYGASTQINISGTYDYTCSQDNVVLVFTMWRKDAGNIALSELDNLSVMYKSHLWDKIGTIEQSVEALESNIPSIVEDVSEQLISDAVEQATNFEPFFKNWYNVRFISSNGRVPAAEYTTPNNSFLCSTNSAAKANSFPRGTVLNLTINEGFRYFITIFNETTLEVVEEYTESTYQTNQLTSNADGLKIFILVYKRDASAIAISESNNVKAYVYENDIKKRIISAETRIQALEDAGTDVSSVFSGKTAVFLGDSLTEVNQHYTKGWHAWVKEIIGLDSYTNYGVSGSSISLTGGMCQRYSQMVDADLVFVMGGTNDCLKSVPIGTDSDTGIDTLYGALNVLCSGLKSKYPTSLIVFVTPHYQTKYPHSSGYTAMDISKVIKDVCYKYAIPVYDNCQLSGIYEDNLIYFTVDNCHWNNAGHEMVGKNIGKWMLDTFRYIYR